MKLGGIAIRLLILAFVLFELLSPLVIRSQLDGNASRAAFEAVLEFERTNSVDAAKEAALRQADSVGAKIFPDDPNTPRDPKTGIGDEGFWRDAEGTFHVVMTKEAPSILMSKWSQTKSWYIVKIEGTSAKRTI